MNIDIVWHQPEFLLDASSEHLTFYIDDERIPEEPGCYVFFSQYGNSKSIIYIGKAENLRRRINGQFKNNVRLMNVIKNFGKGYKKIMFCTVNLKRGQRTGRILAIVEKSLIKHALTTGHELINLQGTKFDFHEIQVIRGNRIAGSLFGRKILSQER